MVLTRRHRQMCGWRLLEFSNNVISKILSLKINNTLWTRQHLSYHWSWPATRCVGGDCQISRLGMSHSHCFAPSDATLSLWICHFLYFPSLSICSGSWTVHHSLGHNLVILFFQCVFSSSQRSLWFSEICWQTRLDWKETWCIPIHTISAPSQQSDL